MNSKDRFTSTLVMLADLTGKNISIQLHDIYFNALESLGIDNVTRVLMKYIEKMKFPSIENIREDLDITADKPDPDMKARLLAQKVVTAIGKFGWCNEKDAMAYFTDDERDIVKAWGTWQAITDIDDAQMFQAQFREFAKAYSKNEQYNSYLSLSADVKKLIEDIPF